MSITYDHMHLTARDPVRSPIYKQVTAGLVVASVTSSESPVLYVFGFWILFLASCCRLFLYGAKANANGSWGWFPLSFMNISTGVANAM